MLYNQLLVKWTASLAFFVPLLCIISTCNQFCDIILNILNTYVIR